MAIREIPDETALPFDKKAGRAAFEWIRHKIDPTVLIDSMSGDCFRRRDATGRGGSGPPTAWTRTSRASGSRSNRRTRTTTPRTIHQPANRARHDLADAALGTASKL